MDSDNLCRLCARQSTSLKYVFSFENGRLVTDLIAVICPIRIEINDDFPKSICDECKEVIVSANKLREISVKSDLKFRTGNLLISMKTSEASIIIKQEETRPELVVEEIVEEDPFGSYFEKYSENEWEEDDSQDTTESSTTAKKKPTRSSLERKRTKVSKEERWPCLIKGCGEFFSHQTNIKRHFRRFHDPELLQFSCSMCTFRFKSQQKLNLHLVKAHKADDESTGSQQEVKIKESFECDSCGLKYATKEGIVQHLNAKNRKISGMNTTESKVSHASVFYCDICSKEFSFISNMYRHKKRFHCMDDQFACNLCTNRFKSLRILELHQKRFHENEDSVETQSLKQEAKGLVISGDCQFCGKNFQGFKRRLETHCLRDHYDEIEEVLECDLCPKKFAFAETLRVHIQTHKKKVKMQSFPHGCETCSRRFLSEENLMKHMESHKAEIGFTCHVCGKTMSCASGLERHILRHEVLKEFPCPQCPAQFVASNELNRHLVTHETNRPFACELCPMTFKIHEVLKRHMKRVHYKTMERKHDCDFCLKKFFTPYSLARHVRIHTGEKPFKCQFCESSYTQKGDCLKHMQRVHVGDALYPCSMDECTATFRLKTELTDHFKVHYQ